MNNPNQNPLDNLPRNSHAKLLASTIITSNNNNNTRVEAVGTVVFRDHKADKFLKFSLDDGTAVVTCLLWLNQLTSPHLARRLCAADLSLSADAALRSAHAAALGSVARVRGRLAQYRGHTQITVSDVVAETDPNAQTLHWLDCLWLSKRLYMVGKSTD